MRYFKYVGSEQQATEYSKPRPKCGVIYPEDHKISGQNAGYYATCNEEWQEVFVYDEEQALSNQKSFPPDAVTLDTYQNGKWYDVREVIPSHGIPNLRVKYGDGTSGIKNWNNILEGFVDNNGNLVDDVIIWMFPNVLSW